MSSFPDYDFSPYLESLGRNWYLEDGLLRRILSRLAPQAAEASEALLVDFGERAAGVYRELAEVIERPEKLPTISRKDAYDRRHDHVVLPPETLRMLAEQHGARLAGGELNDLVRYGIIFLLAQNGETGTLCSLACTDGLIRALRELGNDCSLAEDAGTPPRQHAGELGARGAVRDRGSGRIRCGYERRPGGTGGRRAVSSLGQEVVLLELHRRLLAGDGSSRGSGGGTPWRGPLRGAAARRGRRAQRLLHRPAQGQARDARASDRRDRLRRCRGLDARPARSGPQEHGRHRAGHLPRLQRARRGGADARGVAHRERLLRVSRGLRLAHRPDAAGRRRRRAHPARNPTWPLPVPSRPSTSGYGMRRTDEASGTSPRGFM